MFLQHTLFSSLHQPQPQQMFPSTLVILNIFETNTVNCLQTALCGGSRQTVSCDKVDLLPIEQVICPKCCWIPETVAQLSSMKMRFCKTSEISQKTSKIVSLFCKTASSQVRSCNAKKDTITGLFLGIYLCEYVVLLTFFYIFTYFRTPRTPSGTPLLAFCWYLTPYRYVHSANLLL